MAATRGLSRISLAGGNTRRIGGHWEKVAESFLHRRGLTTRVRNFTCRGGEIDLVMNDGEALVFVEVRYRARDQHGSGAESVSYTKQTRLIRAARFYLGCHPRLSQRPCRFDVISVSGQHGKSQLTWIENAFDSPPG